MKENALARTLGRNRLGRDYGPDVIRLHNDAMRLVWQYQPQSSEECDYDAAMMFELFTIVSFNSSMLVSWFARRAQLLRSVVETVFIRYTAWKRTPCMLAIGQATFCQCDNAHFSKPNSCGRSRIATAQPQKKFPKHSVRSTGRPQWLSPRHFRLFQTCRALPPAVLQQCRVLR
jgi:hypothetical protein